MRRYSTIELSHGAAAVQGHPLVRIHDGLFGIAEAARDLFLPKRRMLPKPCEREEIKEIIRNGAISPVYQQIFSLGDMTLFGYEALSRVTMPTVLPDVESLFARSAEYGLSGPLEMLCRQKALRTAKELALGGSLFLNVSPSLLQSGVHERGVTAALLEELDIPRSRVVFEITERAVIDDYELFLKALSHYRDQGYSIAIDDLGSGYAGLKMLAKLEPEYVKLSGFLISAIETSPTRQALVEALVSFCDRIGAVVIAEGIETDKELEFLRGTGVPLGQGYLLGRPSAVPPAWPIPSFGG